MENGDTVKVDHTSETPRAFRFMNRRVLIVEDHSATAVILRRLLEMEGFAVTVAATTAAAIEAVTKNDPFDVVLSDLLLPDGGGAEVVIALRKQGAVPAIAVTGMYSRDMVVTAREMGFAKYICKPFRFEDLRTAIAACVYG
jgi:DNA-binding response OmpR family regulator